MPRVASWRFIDESSTKCNECGLVLAQPSALRRHMRTHEIGMAQVKHKCSWPDCEYEASQKSNLNTHYRTHSQDKSQACPDCDFRVCDPASLTRHRKRVHGYIPRPRKARATTKNTKFVPYALPTSPSSDSVSDLPSPSSSDTSFSSLSASPEPISSFVDPISKALSKPFFADGLPSNVDDLFYSLSGFECATFDDLRPRPLFPAVESTPSLELFNPLHLSYSADLSLPLGAQRTPYITQPVDIFPRTEVGISACLGSEPLPPSYDSVEIKQVADQDPSIPTTVSDCDLSTVFGGDFERFLQNQMAAWSPSPPWSYCSPSSGFISPASSTFPSSPRPFTGSLLEELNAPLEL